MLTKTMIALGFIGAMAAATATPSLAQGVHFEGRGFGVDVGRPDYRYHHRASATTTLGIGVAATAGQ